MANIVYTFDNQVYLNITNACPCKCTFCIRNNGDSVGDADTLWFEGHTPTIGEIKAEIDAFDFSHYDGEIIFCGYGEPTAAFDNLIETAKYLKDKTGSKLRLNTNGLSDLINKKPTARDICAVIDVVSISLNQCTAEKYNEVTRPAFGVFAYDAMLKFASECRDCGADTRFTVVDVIPKEDIEACRKIADDMKIPLRVRTYTD